MEKSPFKSMKVPFTIYDDMESLCEKISTCYSGPAKSSTKINNHTASNYSLFTHCSFEATKNKLSYFRDKDYKKIVCKDLSM